MPEALVDALPALGPYGALILVIVVYVVERLVVRSDMKALTTNHLSHLQESVDALVTAVQDQTEVLRTIQQDLALQHQTIDYIWQNRTQ